jgi:hypothetical protein
MLIQIIQMFDAKNYLSNATCIVCIELKDFVLTCENQLAVRIKPVLGSESSCQKHKYGVISGALGVQRDQQYIVGSMYSCRSLSGALGVPEITPPVV